MTKQFLGVNEKKMVVGALVGLVGSVAIWNASGGREPIKLKVKPVGGGWVEQEYTLEYDPSSGAWTSKGKATTVGKGRSTFRETLNNPSASPASYDTTPSFHWGEKLR